MRDTNFNAGRRRWGLRNTPSAPDDPRDGDERCSTSTRAPTAYADGIPYRVAVGHAIATPTSVSGHDDRTRHRDGHLGLTARCCPQYMATLSMAAEQVLQGNLATMREAIDKFTATAAATPDKLDDPW